MALPLNEPPPTEYGFEGKGGFDQRTILLLETCRPPADVDRNKFGFGWGTCALRAVAAADNAEGVRVCVAEADGKAELGACLNSTPSNE